MPVSNFDDDATPIRVAEFRGQDHLANDQVKIFTRRGHDWTKHFRKVAGDACTPQGFKTGIDQDGWWNQGPANVWICAAMEHFLRLLVGPNKSMEN